MEEPQPEEQARLHLLSVFRFPFLGSGLGFEFWALGFLVWGVGFGVWGLGFGVWGLGSGFGVWGLGFGVRDLGFGGYQAVKLPAQPLQADSPLPLIPGAGTG